MKLSWVRKALAVSAVLASMPVASGGTLPEVTVEAKSKAMEHQVSDFVRNLTQNPRFRDESREPNKLILSRQN